MSGGAGVFIGNGRGQVGTEYLIITGFLLFAVIVFFTYSMASYNGSVSLSKARGVVSGLANSASKLSGLGNGSSLTVDLDFPEGIQSFQVSGKTVMLFVSDGSKVTEFYAESRLELNSVSLPLNSGPHAVLVSRSGNKVDFSEAK